MITEEELDRVMADRRADDGMKDYARGLKKQMADMRELEQLLYEANEEGADEEGADK